MMELCKSCSGWNDYKGKCDASFWCPDKAAVNVWDEEDECEGNGYSEHCISQI